MADAYNTLRDNLPLKGRTKIVWTSFCFCLCAMYLNRVYLYPKSTEEHLIAEKIQVGFTVGGNVIYDGKGEMDYMRGRSETNAKKTFIKESSQVKKTFGAEISRGTLDMSLFLEGEGKVNYLYCSWTGNEKKIALWTDESVSEILLLQDSSLWGSYGWTMDAWKESGIMGHLCRPERGEKTIVLAIGLHPNALGVDLEKAFFALTEEKILSGRPVVLVTPAESGMTALNLGTLASNLGDLSGRNQSEVMTPTDGILLTRMVKAWITVASDEALESSNDALRAFFLARIPVLSIYCSMHVQAKRSTERLESFAGANAAELEGTSSLCYTNHQKSIAEFILQFLSVV